MANTLDRADTECFPHHTALLDNDALDQKFKIICDTIFYNRIIIVMLKNKILSLSYSHSPPIIT